MPRKQNEIKKIKHYESDCLVKVGFSFGLSKHHEKPEHHPRVMGCDTLTPKDIRLRNIQQTTNPLSGSPNSA